MPSQKRWYNRRQQNPGSQNTNDKSNVLAARIGESKVKKEASDASSKLKANPLFKAINNIKDPASKENNKTNERKKDNGQYKDGDKSSGDSQKQASDQRDRQSRNYRQNGNRYNHHNNRRNYHKDHNGKMSFKGSHGRRNEQHRKDGEGATDRARNAQTNQRHYDNKKQMVDVENSNVTNGNTANERTFNFKHASLPPIMYMKNLEFGTSTEDIKTILEHIGPVYDCRSRRDPEDPDSVEAEVVFLDGDHAYAAVEQFNGSIADGRKLLATITKVHRITIQGDSEELSYPRIPSASSWSDVRRARLVRQ
uniref:ARAD1D38126p n=1 Tax=Blastobotrys adeninivorans TaxID=409370 RepID=A0A060TCR6_BLAAD